MPGIFDQNDGTPNNASEISSVERVGDESSAAAVENASSVPPAEVNQTDKINKFLLKSFLERMNHETLGAAEEDDDTAGNVDEREWQ